MNYTEDQQKVIDSRNESLLVTAAAGSGKTAVLVRRIMERVCDNEHPVDIDRILCLTFTEAAASEMKARLLSLINKALSQDPDNARLRHQSVLVHRSFVMTIDAFCSYVVSNHFQDIGLDPGMRIMEKGAEKVLRRQVIDDYFEELYLLPEDDAERMGFITALEMLSDKGRDDELREIIFAVHEAASGYPYPEDWLNNALEQYRQSSSGTAEWIGELADSTRDIFIEAADILECCAGGCSRIGHEKGVKLLEQDVERVTKTIGLSKKQDSNIERLKVFYDYFQTEHKAAFGKWPVFNGDERECAKRINSVRRDVKAKLDKIQAAYFSFSVERSMRDMESLVPFIETIISLVREFDARFKKKKQEAGLMTFSDCEHYALEILTHRDGDAYLPTETALELSDYFEEVMCDEYQDSNEIQEAILNSVCREHRGENNRFMVGDVKQSIYRFRKANPGLIMSKMEEYGDEGPKKRIDLKMNFRSRREVVDAVNLVFKRLMRPEFGGIDYDERARLVYGAEDYELGAPSLPAELHVLNLDPDGNDDAALSEARLIASIVKENVGKTLVSGEERDENGTRILRRAGYGDIAILLRTMAIAPQLTEVFREEGIPLHITSSKGYFDSPEIVTLLACLRVIENPRQDICLYRVLTSPMAGFTDRDIAVIKSETSVDAGCLYERLKEYEGEELKGKVSSFLDSLSRYRSMSYYESVSGIINCLLEETGFIHYALAMPDGAQRERNLRLFSDKAAEFEKNGSGGLFAFISYIDETVEEQGEDIGPAAVTGDAEDVVRVYSIHKSKGLEFPICIIGNLQRKMNLKDADAKLLLNGSLGIASRYYDPVRRIKKQTILQSYFAACERREQRAEVLRILYVAMTRAREKLIFTAAVKPLAGDVKNNTLPSSRMFSENSFLFDLAAADGRYPVICIEKSGSLLDYVYMGFAGCDGVLREHTADELEDRSVSEKMDTCQRRSMLADMVKDVPEREEIKREFAERFSAPYSHPELAGLYTKTTVSELKKGAYEKETEDSREDAAAIIPQYEEGGGSEFGTAHHRVMELLDIAALSALPASSKEDAALLAAAIDEQMRGMVLDGRMPEKYASYVNHSRIISFLGSPCGKRMQQASHVGALFREQPFFLGVPARELGETFPDDETILIQGIIDVFWQEEDGFVILDYKTDRVKETFELVKRYETQLYYYKRALEAATGGRVKECILYSFCLGEEICLKEPQNKISSMTM